MLLLLIVPIWTVCLLLVAGLCAGARLGDRAQAMQSAELLTAAGPRERQREARGFDRSDESRPARREARVELAA